MAVLNDKIFKTMSTMHSRIKIILALTIIIIVFISYTNIIPSPSSHRPQVEKITSKGNVTNKKLSVSTKYKNYDQMPHRISTSIKLVDKPFQESLKFQRLLEKKQFVRVEQAIKEITEIQAAWISVRDEAYIEMAVPLEQLKLLEDARANMDLEFENHSRNLRESNPSEHPKIIESIQNISDSYDDFVQDTIGPDRYALITQLRDQFNEELKALSQSRAQILNAW